MPQMFAHITHDTALAFPWDAAAPLDRQTQAEHLGVAHLCHWTTTSGHAGLDVALVKIVHDDVQCHQEGFEIEVHAMSPLGKGSIWLSILAETFRSCPVRRDQYASSV